MSEEQLYHLQASHHARSYLDENSLLETLQKVHSDKTTDSFRHRRMLNSFKFLLKEKCKWITFGDGRYGSEASWLLQQGQTVMATDIQDKTLAEAHKFGFVQEFKLENAEKLSFETDSFDWGLCKEAYHHMPRGPIAFYEMLRVCRHGLVLIEPTDLEPKNAWGFFGLAILNLLKPRRYEFEDSGNFIYSLSRKEIEKMLLGIGLRHYAYYHTSDHYINGAEQEILPGPLYRKIIRSIFLKELFKKVLGLSGKFGVFIIFKDGKSIPENLSSQGFQLYELPKNPYLS